MSLPSQCSKKWITFMLIWMQVLCEQSYRINVTYQQMVYWRRTLPYIQQFTGKRCTKASLMAQQRFCRKRCQLMYNYIPDAPYKNYIYYNTTSKDCQPKVVCPQIFTVQYDVILNRCFDMSTGDVVKGVDAKPPKINNSYEVQFICVNGYVGMHKGKKQCICKFGWMTKFQQGYWTDLKFKKCNLGISIFDYLPTAVQIYYDTLIDLPFPHPADPQYWPKILILYLRELKYTVVTSIWPIQVQLTLLAVPTQSLIRDQDLDYVIPGGIVLAIILLVSIYQKMKNTRTMQEIIAKQSNNAVE